MEVDRAVIFSEIPRNSSLILEEKENLKKILEEKKIPRFRPLEMIEKVFQYGDIHVQYLYLPNISASIAKAIINGMMRGGREEGYSLYTPPLSLLSSYH